MKNALAVKTAIAIRHVHFEDLGTFEAVLAAEGYRIHYHDIGTNELWTLNPLSPDLLIILGAPIGTYEEDTYPYLVEEREILKQRLAAGFPTIGICLGAQQIAATLGAEVKPSGSKEIGFSLLTLSQEGTKSPLRHLEGVPVLHWHGDILELPQGALHLASTPLCKNQAFMIGKKILGLQFHPEVDACAGIERWLTGHAVELSLAKIDPRKLREDAVKNGAELREASRRMLAEWLKEIET